MDEVNKYKEKGIDREFWKVTRYKWGEIGNLKNEYKNTISIDNDKVRRIEDRKEGYWVFGSFVGNESNESLAMTNDFEFKYWFFKKGEECHHEPKFQIIAREYNFIIKGKIKGRVGDKKDIILEAGDYIIIEPGEIVNLQQEIIEDVEGMTIKTPSRHGDTIKHSFIEKLGNFEKENLSI